MPKNILLFLATSIFAFSSVSAQIQLLPIKQNYKWGYCDTTGKTVIEPSFDHAYPFVCKLAKFKTKGKYGVVDATGKIIVDAKEDSINIFCPDYISVLEDSAWGLDDINGNSLLDPAYQKIVPDKQDIFFIWKNGLKGLFHARSKNILKPVYKELSFYKGFYLANENGKKGLFDSQLNQIVPTENNDIEPVDSSTILVKQKDFWAVVSVSGGMLTKYDYMSYKILSDRYVMMKAKLGGWHLYSIPQRKIISTETQENYQLLTDNIILTIKTHKMGAISETGATILGQFFSNIHYNNGLLLVERDSKWGLADATGKFIIETIHDRLFPFKKNFAVFESASGKGIVDKTGKIIVTPTFKEIDLKDNIAIGFSYDGKVQTIKLPLPVAATKSKTKSSSSSQSPQIIVNNTLPGHAWLKGEGRKWGLVGHDTIFIPFKYDEVETYNSLSLAYVKIDYRTLPKMYGYINQQKLNDKAQQKITLVDIHSGKAIYQGAAWYYRLSDFATGQYAKFIHEGGLQALISQSGAVISEYSFLNKEKKTVKQPLSYIGPFNEGIASYCIGCVMNYAGDWESNKASNGKWGYISQSGKFISEPIFEEAGNFYNNRAIVKLKGQYGVIDSEANFVLKPEYSSIAFLENSNNKLLKVETKKDRFGLIDNKGRLITQIAYDKIFPFSEGHARVMIAGKYGFIDTMEHVVVSPKYDNANDFSEGMAAVNIGKLWGFIDSTGNQAILPMSPAVGSFKNGLAPASKDGKMAYINKDGKLMTAPMFYTAGLFTNGVAVVSTEGTKKGLIDTEGNKILEEQYDDIQFLAAPGYAKLRQDNQWKLYSTAQKKILNKKAFEEIGEFNENMLPVKNGEYYNYVDTTGKIAISKKYTAAGKFSQGLAAATLDGKTGYIDAKGVTKILFTLNSSTEFNSNRAFTQNSNKLWAIIDKNGKNITTPIFLSPKPFSYGAALVNSGREYYFVDTTGSFLFKERFELAYPFECGVARVKSKKWGLLSPLGYHYVDYKYDYIGEFSNNQAVVGIYQSVGIFDLDGNVVVEPSFDMAIGVSPGIIRVERSDALGYIKPDKTIIVEIKK